MKAVPDNRRLSRGRNQHLEPRMVALLSCCSILIWSPSSCAAEPVRTPEKAYRVLRTLPHDPAAFTQGLIFYNGRFLESTGLYGESTLREVEVETGKVLRRRSLPSRYFGEGIALWSNRIFQLTWREQVLFVYDAETFETIGSHPWRGEGWGLTLWSNRLVASDGTDRLRFYDPQTLQPLGEIVVHEKNRTIRFLNELETVGDEIFANVWRSDRIARINPITGEVVGWLDVSDLVPPSVRGSFEAVLNGIAYDPDTGRLYITGKRWPVVYEMILRDKE